MDLRLTGKAALVRVRGGSEGIGKGILPSEEHRVARALTGRPWEETK